MANKAHRHKDDRRRCKPPQSPGSELSGRKQSPKKKVAAYLREASASTTTSINKVVAGAIAKYGDRARRRHAKSVWVGSPI